MDDLYDESLSASLQSVLMFLFQCCLNNYQYSIPVHTEKNRYYYYKKNEKKQKKIEKKLDEINTLRSLYSLDELGENDNEEEEGDLEDLNLLNEEKEEDELNLLILKPAKRMYEEKEEHPAKRVKEEEETPVVENEPMEEEETAPQEEEDHNDDEEEEEEEEEKANLNIDNYKKTPVYSYIYKLSKLATKPGVSVKVRYWVFDFFGLFSHTIDSDILLSYIVYHSISYSSSSDRC